MFNNHLLYLIKAMENTNFDTAVEFFAAGRKYLGYGWDVDFKLMLRLASLKRQRLALLRETMIQ